MVFLSQVVMLSSITELHSYIDHTQLTQELGGTQEYCHEKWLSHRTVRTHCLALKNQPKQNNTLLLQQISRNINNEYMK